MKIALTFDIERDIPNLLDTNFGVTVGLLKILEVLDNFNIKGTFFCTGNVAEELPEYIRVIERKGHEIACHSLNHERLTQLSFEKCQEIIYKNKKIIENTCKNSEIIGFRAPYLSAPKFLFKILKDLGFSYDSSIVSSKKLSDFQIKDRQIQEFPPLNVPFRLPIGYFLTEKRMIKKQLNVLFFHPWEAINIKKLMYNQISMASMLKNILFRPDRWINTGDQFIARINNFIKDSISKKAEFIMLKQLIIEKREKVI